MSDTRLLPCPFCGGEAMLVYYHEELGLVHVDSEEELEDDSISAFVHCFECSTEVFPYEAEKPKEVIEAWNTRKPIDRIVEELESVTFLMPPKNKGHYADNGLFLEDAIEIVRKGGV